MHYRVSVSTLDAYRRWVASNETVGEKYLIEAILRKAKTSAKQMMGIAWHEALQTKLNVKNLHTWHDKTYLDVNGICLPQQSVQVIKGYQQQVDTKFSEIKTMKDYKVGIDTVTVTMRLDIVDNGAIRDIKLRFSPMADVHDYIDSCQWKFYCEALECPVAYYDVFIAHGFNDNQLSNSAKDFNGKFYFPKLRIQQEQELKVTSYDGMTKELEDLIFDFFKWAKYRKIDTHMLVDADRNTTGKVTDFIQVRKDPAADKARKVSFAREAAIKASKAKKKQDQQIAPSQNKTSIQPRLWN